MILDKLWHQTGWCIVTFFARYIRELINALIGSRIGCNIGSLCVNVLAYADDIVILAPAWCAMQQLLYIFDEHTRAIDMTCNVIKTVCMVFSPSDRSKVVASYFPLLKIGANCIQFVQKFKYLVHVICRIYVMMWILNVRFVTCFFVLICC